MTFAVTSLGSLGDTNSRSDYTVPLARAPNANNLILVGVDMVDVPIGTVVEPSAISGAGMVFSLITSSITYNPTTGGSQVNNLSVWRGMSSAPDSSLITVHGGFAGSASGCAVVVVEVGGVNSSGASGANAVGKSANSVADGTSRLTVIAPAAASTANAWILFSGMTRNLTDVAGPGYTAIDEGSHTVPGNRILSAWTTLSTGTIVGVGGAGADNRAGVLIELVAASVVTATSAGALGRRFRIPQVPVGIKDPVVAQYLKQVVLQLNNEGFISLFSGTNPNTSGLTGVPGSLALNIGSASTWTRLWVQGGSVASVSTTSWHPFAVM